jgi:hypothetical protein
VEFRLFKSAADLNKPAIHELLDFVGNPLGVGAWILFRFLLRGVGGFLSAGEEPVHQVRTG